MNVVFAICWQIIVDNERHLLHVDTSSQQVRSDQDTRRSRAELLHDDFSIFLIHVSVLKVEKIPKISHKFNSIQTTPTHT